MNQSDLETTPIVAHANFSVADFLSRWQRARVATLLSAIPDSTDLSENALIRCAATRPTDIRDQILKELFRNCWRLGQSTKRFFAMTWELDDFKDILAHGTIPCFRGEWIGTGKHLTLKRTGCNDGSTIGSFACDYWREALDGIVMGCGDSARYVRWKNKVLGDDYCEDVYFLESDATSHRYAPISPNVLAALAPTLESIARLRITINLKGINGDDLYYELLSQDSLGCSSVPSIARTMFQKAVAKHFPRLKIVDVSPRSVLVS